MEDYLDHYFSASSCSDVNLIDKSSWLHNAPIQPNLQLPNHTGLYQGDDIDSPVSMINSTLSFDGSAAEDAPFLVPGGAAGSAIDHGVLPGEASHYVNCSNDSIISSNGAFNGGDLTSSHSLGESGYIEIADPITCEFGGPLGEFETFSPLPQAGLPFQSCDDTVSLSSLIGQNGRHSSNLLGGQADDDEGGNINRYVDIDNIVKPENLCTSVTEENQELQNYILPSVAAGYQITDKMIGLASLSQTESPTPNFNSNGATKPRVRARRGQATDPHSIAERLRRERIAERMKNLQELVPNSHKTDKASMLDEIIEYVKFLQMQVKVLSMSRVGATEAVVPLITDGQAEVSNRTHVSPSADQTAFEQEVVKLMESNVTRAMQYLQTKGLCLMPIALATAISKGSAALKSDGKKPDNGNSLVHNNGSSSSSDSNSSLAAGVRTNHFSGKDTAVVGKIKREGSSSNGFDDIAKPKS